MLIQILYNALLRRGADPHICDSNGLTVLHRIAKLPDDVTENCSDIDVQIESIQERVKSTIEQLCSAGCSPNQRTKASSTPLHIVAEYNSRAIIENHWIRSIKELRQRASTIVSSLIRRGASIDAEDTYRRTPLHVAALWGSSDSVRVLIKAGASIDIVLKNNWTLLHLVSISFQAVIRQYKEWFEHDKELLNLLKESLDLDAEWWALDRTNIGLRTMTKESIEAIIEAGCDINTRDEMGRTPLHLACKLGTPDRIESILDAGSDPDLRDNCGLVPWDYLRSRQDVDWTSPSRSYVDIFERLSRQLKLCHHSCR